jgi:hypothetical protein
MTTFLDWFSDTLRENPVFCWARLCPPWNSAGMGPGIWTLDLGAQGNKPVPKAYAILRFPALPLIRARRMIADQM